MRDRIKICMVINDLRCGGAERVFSYIANGLSSKYDVCMVNLMGASYDFFSCNAQVKYIALEKLFGDPQYRHLRRVAKLQSIIHEMAPDVIISFLDEAICYCGAIKRGKAALIVSERNDPHYQNNNPMIEYGKRKAFSESDAIVVQSMDVLNFMSSAKEFKCAGLLEMISNPITSLPTPIPYSERRNEVVAVGRYTEQKNYPLMLKSFSIFLKRHPNFILKIFGKQYGNKEQLEKIAVDFGISDYVVFEKERQDIQDAIKYAKCFLMTSNYEGFPNALIEAMGLGIPPVVTECYGGIKDLIVDGNNGLLVPKGDELLISEALCKIIEDSTLAISISKEAEKVRDMYDGKKILDNWDSLIQKIITAKGISL